jgi:hypothetical protein
MPKIKEYLLVVESDYQALEARVNDYIKRGWQPWQSPSMVAPVQDEDIRPAYLQAVVKFEAEN